ncbi:hypothetical protein [Paraburkholderia sp. SIMBA_030]|uniref:hypothetical protein n=1 Tax=Paraburkholderia sp. SIMBA_030 TaxID=3085773 RepID=UPI003978B7A5
MLKYKIASMLAALAVIDTAHAAGLCSANETIVFNCELKENHKIVSMCSSKDLTDKKGFLQYRYGLPNKVELTFPKSRENSQAQFGYDEYSRPDLSTFVVGFNNANYRYEISETTEGGEDVGVTTRSLLVSSEANKRGLKLTCLDNKNTVSNISTLDHVLNCDKKRAIVEGACD